MKLPPTAYASVAVLAGLLLICGLTVCAAGIRNWSRFFSLRPIRHIDNRLGRRGARWFCLTIGAVISILAALLLVVSTILLVPERRLRSIDPLPIPEQPAQNDPPAEDQPVENPQ